MWYKQNTGFYFLVLSLGASHRPWWLCPSNLAEDHKGQGLARMHEHSLTHSRNTSPPLYLWLLVSVLCLSLRVWAPGTKPGLAGCPVRLVGFHVATKRDVMLRQSTNYTHQSQPFFEACRGFTLNDGQPLWGQEWICIPSTLMHPETNHYWQSLCCLAKHKEDSEECSQRYYINDLLSPSLHHSLSFSLKHGKPVLSVTLTQHPQDKPEPSYAQLLFHFLETDLDFILSDYPLSMLIQPFVIYIE